LYTGLRRRSVFIIEDIKRRQTHIGHFLLTKSDFVTCWDR
jgi:hypothetical protein